MVWWEFIGPYDSEKYVTNQHNTGNEYTETSFYVLGWDTLIELLRKFNLFYVNEILTHEI